MRVGNLSGCCWVRRFALDEPHDLLLKLKWQNMVSRSYEVKGNRINLNRAVLSLRVRALGFSF